MGRYPRLITCILITIFTAGSAGCLQWFQRPSSKLSDHGYVEIKGSDTMVNLAQTWAERFMEVNEETYISVTGGGSGTGIAALINDNTDIAASSRRMKDHELKLARKKGIEIWEFPVAIDALAVTVNKENPIESLSLPQLKDIFTGRVQTWSELGWQEGGRISVYSRQSNSGTYVFFNEHVMDGEDWAPHTKFLPGSASLNDAIKADRAGIGYYGVGYIEGVKPLKIKGREGEEPVSPLDIESVSNGRYPLSRPLFLYTNGRPTGTVLEFLKFVLSEEGQELVVEEEYYRLGKELLEQSRAKLMEAREEVE